MAVFGDFTYGIGAPKLYYYEGGRWITITCPEHTRLAGSPLQESFEDVDPIDEVLADGTSRIVDRGCKLIATIVIDPATKELYAQLCVLRAWQKQHPTTPFIYQPYLDKQEAYYVYMRGPFSGVWPEGMAVGYRVTFGLSGANLLDGPEPDNELVSHYCDTSVSYDATDTGIDSYAATGCPWEFGNYLDGELPPQWLTSGSSAKARIRNTKGALQYGLRSQGAEISILNFVTPDSGTSEMLMWINAGIGGLVWRCNAGMTTYYSARLDTATNTVKIYKNAATLLATYTPPLTLATETWYGIRVKHLASVHTTYICLYNPLTSEQDWYFLGSITDASYTTGYSGQLTIAGGDILGNYHDIYSTAGVRADIDDTSADLAAYYCQARKALIPA